MEDILNDRTESGEAEVENKENTEKTEAAAKGAELSDTMQFSAISDIIHETRQAAAEEESEKADETGGEDDDDEKTSAIEISESPAEEKAVQTEALNKLKNRIKRSELLDPKVIKDMFFGTENEHLKESFDSEEDSEDEEDEEQPILFDKSRKKRLTADPKQEKKLFDVEYMVTPAQAASGYELFYGEFVKPKNIKLTVLFGIAAAVLLLLWLFTGGYINILLMIISLSVIAFTWLSSLNAGRQARLSADDIKNDSYKLSFYNSRILIEASELSGDRVYKYSPVMIRFEDIDLKVIDCDSIYVLVLKKDYIYTVPKSALSEAMNKAFKKHLANILGDDYREYYIKQQDSEQETD